MPLILFRFSLVEGGSILFLNKTVLFAETTHEISCSRKKRFRQTIAYPKIQGNYVSVELSLQGVLISGSLKCSCCCPEHKTTSE